MKKFLEISNKIFIIAIIIYLNNLFADSQIQNISISPSNPSTNSNITITFQIRADDGQGNAMFAIGLSKDNSLDSDDDVCKVNWLATNNGIYQGSGTPSTTYWWLDGVSQTATGLYYTDVLGPSPGLNAGSGSTWKTVTVITHIPPEHAGSGYYINFVTRQWGDLKAQCCGASRNYNVQYSQAITISGTPTVKADLQMCDSSTVNNGNDDEIRVGFRIYNWGESGIYLDKFSFRYYLNDSLTCANWSGQPSTGFQAYYSNGSTYCGAQNPTTQVSCQDLASTIDCGNNRKANKYLVFSTQSLPSRPYLIPPVGGYFQTTSPLPYWRSNPRAIDPSDDYTKTKTDAPACGSGYGDVKEVPLYYDNQIVCEWKLTTGQVFYACTDAGLSGSNGHTTYVERNNPNQNNAPNSNMRVDTWGGINFLSRGLSIADLSSIPTGAIISSASYSLYQQNCQAATNMTISRVTTNWVYNQATYNSPTASNQWASGQMSSADWTTIGENTISVPCNVGSRFTWNATDIVRAWVSGSAPNYGVTIHLADESAANVGCTFVQQPAGNDNIAPKFVINYTNYEANSGTEPCYQNQACLNATPTPTPLIGIVKSASKQTVTLGETITFCLAITNNTSSSQTFNVWDTIPYVTTYRGCDNSCSTTTIGSNFIVYWTISNIAPGQTVNRCFWVEVTSLPENWLEREIFVNLINSKNFLLDKNFKIINGKVINIQENVELKSKNL